MTLNYSTPVVNPRLGSGFAIFASTYTCLVLLLIVLEQLGLPVQTIDSLIVTMPALFYIAIGFMTRTTGAEDFFLAGQRVPPFYNALALCGAVFGGSILLGSIGAFFFVGIDALAIVLGCFAGLILTGVLFVPHLRKAGANTLPGFLHLRFGRSRVRFVAALLMIAPAVIVLVAEVALGGKILGYLLPLPQMLGIGLAPRRFLCGHRLRLPVFHRGPGRNALGHLDARRAIHRGAGHSRPAGLGFGDADEFAAAAAHLWRGA